MAILVTGGAGFIGSMLCKLLVELAAGLHRLLDSPERWAKASRAARQYYLDNHTVESVMARFEQIFLDVMKPATDGGDSL